MPDALVFGEDATAAFHARALRRAGHSVVMAGVAAPARDALDSWLARRRSGWLVPHPLMPHLLLDWLGCRSGRRPGEVPRGWDLPFERPGAGGALYLSAAAWLCPATCVEPAHCPALHAPRDWSLAAIIAERARRDGLIGAVFALERLGGGVGGVPVDAVLDAERRLHSDPRPALVGTSSHCHAAVGVLALPSG